MRQAGDTVTSRRLRSGYDWFGLSAGWGLIAVGALMIVMTWLAGVAESVVAAPGYRMFGIVLGAIGLALVVIAGRNGVWVNRRGIGVVRPLRRAVRVSWSEVAGVTVVGRGSAFAAQAILLTDGSRILTPLTERDHRLPLLWRRIALHRGGVNPVPQPGPRETGQP